MTVAGGGAIVWWIAAAQSHGGIAQWPVFVFAVVAVIGLYMMVAPLKRWWPWLAPDGPGPAVPHSAVLTRPDGLLPSLRAARREGHGLAGEAASLDPIGNFGRLDNLVQRYNAFEGRVADLLAGTDELDPMWQAEWLRDPEWHSPDVFPIEREQLDGMARMIGHRVGLVDRMIRELVER